MMTARTMTDQTMTDWFPQLLLSNTLQETQYQRIKCIDMGLEEGLTSHWTHQRRLQQVADKPGQP